MRRQIAVGRRPSTCQDRGANVTPNPSLDRYKPVELLRAAELRPALGAIDATAEGVYV